MNRTGYYLVFILAGWGVLSLTDLIPSAHAAPSWSLLWWVWIVGSTLITMVIMTWATPRFVAHVLTGKSTAPPQRVATKDTGYDDPHNPWGRRADPDL